MGQPPKHMKRAYGGVLINAEGRVLLREPAKHYGGYIWTFPKGRADVGEVAEVAAVREVLEESGWRAVVVAEIPKWFLGDVTATRFFLMKPVEDTGHLDEETIQIRWVAPAEARALIGLTTSPRGRERDLQVLEAANSLWNTQVKKHDG